MSWANSGRGKTLFCCLCVIFFSFSRKVLCKDLFLNRIYFDANQSTYDKNNGETKFIGDVVVIAPGFLVSADKIIFSSHKNTITAEGNISFQNSNQFFNCENMVVYLEDEKVELSEVSFSFNDEKLLQNNLKKILGYYEEKKKKLKDIEQKRIEIEKRKFNLKIRYKESPSSEKKDIENNYLLLLEQDQNLIKIKSSILTNGQQKDNLFFRQRFWETYKSYEKDPLVNFKGKVFYFSMKSSKILKIGDNKFKAFDSDFTVCRCEQGEKPPWSLFSRDLSAELGGYANFNDLILKVKGVPLLYLPHATLPLKFERETGLLPPTLVWGSESGSVMKQPFFLAVSSNKDLTFDAEFHEKRGLKLSSEFRWQTSQNSSWFVKLDGVHDRLWLEQNNLQNDIKDQYVMGFLYSNGLEQKNNVYPKSQVSDFNDPAWWKKQGYESCFVAENTERCLQKIEEDLTPYENKFRGQINVLGNMVISPRFFWNIESQYVSDHMYNEDYNFYSLYNPKDFSSANNVFNHTKHKFSYRHQDFSLSLGSIFSDSMILEKPYSGHQIPFEFILQSRHFLLFDKFEFSKLYGSVKLEHKNISLNNVETVYNNNLNKFSLSNGYWQRYFLSFNLTLLENKPISTDWSFNLERRVYDHQIKITETSLENSIIQNYEKRNSVKSSVNSLHTALTFKLPMQRDFLIFESYEQDKNDISFIQKFIRHSLVWDISFSSRPSLWREGKHDKIKDLYDYDSVNQSWLESSSAKEINFFPSDFSDQTFILGYDETQMMKIHKKIIFHTNHNLSFYNKKLIKKTNEDNKYKEKLDKRSHYELEESTKNITDFYLQRKNFFDEPESKNWNELFFTFDAKIDYDFAKQERINKENIDLSQLIKDEDLYPWSPLYLSSNLSLNNYVFNFQNTYDFNIELSRRNVLSFYVPINNHSSLRLSYTLDREVFFNNEKNTLNTFNSKRYELKLTFGQISRFSFFLFLGKKINLKEKINQLAAQTGVTYNSSTECWGFKFVWNKQYEDPSSSGQYLLSFFINTWERKKELPNLLSRFNRE